jgi:OmcA/MtrC family decaheme c-type cytochrome
MLCGLVATAAAALILISCRGAAGQNGANGANGTNGTNGTNGSNGAPGATYALDATTLSPEEWGELSLTGTVTSVSMATGTPVVNFTVKEGHNIPVKGLGFTSKTSTAAFASFANMGFSIAKLVPGADGSPSKWVNYIVVGNPTAAAPTTWVPGRPSTDSIGTLVDKGDGSYTYTFRRDITQTKAQLDAYTYTGNNIKADLGDVTYQPTLTHRITAYVGGNARGTGTNTADGSNSGVPTIRVKFPANFFYDFVPATGSPVGAANEAREMVQTSSCFTCHAKFEFHGEGRQDTKYCVVCHTDQRKYGYAEAAGTPTGYDIVAGQRKIQGRAVGDFTNMVHAVHMGEELHKDGYNYANVFFNHVTYPQDHRNCVKCHTNTPATPQGDNWFKKPSRLACGACHDAIKWETGEHHAGGSAFADNQCAQCHTEADIKLAHIPILPPDPNNRYLNPTTGNNNTNASYLAAFANNLPAGSSKVTWDLKSLTFNPSGKPVVTFRFIKDGAPVVFNSYPAKSEMMDDFVGGPSIYVAFTVPYDGITYPADWNATISTYLKNIWRGDGKDMTGAALSATAKAALAGPDGTGYYTLTFTDAIIPTNAGMVTAGIGYTYNLTSAQPLTQTNVPGFPYNVEGKKQGGVSVPAPNVTKMVSGTLPAGFDTTQATTPRRAIVENKRCNDCHGVLGVFTAKTYHAGQRNDAATCEFCHNGQRVNSGWGVNAKDFVHALHGAKKRENKYSWEASAGFKYWTITYPSVLNNCEACHVPGSYDFGNTTNAGEVPNLNWTTVATGNIPNPVPVIITGNEPIPGTYFSPFVTAGAAYGTGFSYNAGTGVTTPAAPTTLVSSPYVAACSNCHDSKMALNHMKANGGSFYVSRASVLNTATGALINTEQCFLCHSSGKIADTKKVHMDFK